MQKFTITMAAVGLSIALVTGAAFASGPERQAGSTQAQVEQKIYGTIRSLPQTEIGIWDVDGKQVEVTKATRIVENHGKAGVGATVEIEGIAASGKAFSARKVEVKRAKR